VSEPDLKPPAKTVRHTLVVLLLAFAVGFLRVFSSNTFFPRTELERWLVPTFQGIAVAVIPTVFVFGFCVIYNRRLRKTKREA
jgi:hypothetical protein